jgi:ubiquinone biosynthesis protein
VNAVIACRSPARSTTSAVRESSIRAVVRVSGSSRVSLSEISLAIMLQQLLGILQQHQLHLPQETALLFKVLMMAEGPGSGP